jgi:hypothetical protein
LFHVLSHAAWIVGGPSFGMRSSPQTIWQLSANL